MSKISPVKFACCALALAMITAFIFYDSTSTRQAIVISKSGAETGQVTQIISDSSTTSPGIGRDGSGVGARASYSVGYVDITQTQIIASSTSVPTSNITVPKTPDVKLSYQDDALMVTVELDDIKSFKLFKKINDGSYSQIGIVAGNKYIDTDILGGNTYTYKATCTTKEGIDVYSNESAIFIEKLSNISNVSGLCKLNEITLSWDAVIDASKYNIYKEQGDKLIIIASVGSASYTDTAVIANTEYTYKIEARDSYGNKIAESEKSAYKTLYLPGATELSLYSNEEHGIQLVWRPDKDSISYNVYKYNGSEFMLVKNTKNNYYLDSAASGVCSYYVTVIANGGEGERSNIITATAEKE